MSSLGKGKVVSVCLGLAVVAVAVVVLAGQVAGARTPRQVKTVALLSLPQGSFEISLGTAPSWLPLSRTSETLTLIAGAPRRTSSDNAYVGFTRANRTCAATPAESKATYYTLSDFYAASHRASRNAGAFAPNGGAARGTYLDSVTGVRIPETDSARACIWIASARSVSSRSAARSLSASVVIPLLNDTFAASVSNLTGATAGSGGYSMFAFSGGHRFTYSVSTTQCARTSSDNTNAVAAGTPASETVSISTSPCSGDLSTFRFQGPDTHNASLAYLVADALASPPTTLTTGGCELDPLTGVEVGVAESYLKTVGCSVGEIEVSPYVKALPRGAVSWVSVDGGVADIAPAGTRVDLVVNG